MSLHINQEARTELRKVQALHKGNNLVRTYTVALPIRYIRLLGIEQGDFMKFRLENQKMILEKAEV